MFVNLENSWKHLLEEELEKPYFRELIAFVKSEYKTSVCYPPHQFIFAAFDHCSFDNLKVVILGQDPYHGPGQANGLCFSVNEGVPIPPSLQNIYKEINTDLDIQTTVCGNLQHWADQGILLLNATLTVRAHLAGSHQKKGWENFTDAVIRLVNEKKHHVVFILWGGYAQKKGAFIDESKHLVIRSAHPSPLSAYNGFWNSKPFSKTNAYLRKHGKTEINWVI